MLKKGTLGRSGWLTLAAGAAVTIAAVMALRSTTAPTSPGEVVAPLETAPNDASSVQPPVASTGASTGGSGSGGSDSGTTQSSAGAGASISAAPSGAPVTRSSDEVVPMTPLSADDPLGVWMRAFAQTLGAELGGDLGPGTLGRVNGVVTGVYRSGTIVDFAILAESAVITAGGVVTSRSLPLQSVHARFIVRGQPSRVELTLVNGRLTIVALPG